MVTAGGVVHEQLFTQVAVLAVLQYRREGGALGREEPFARMTGCGCFFCGCSLGALRQTCQLRLVRDKALHIIAVGLGNDVVTKFEREQCQFLVNLFEALFLVLRQVGSVVGEVLVGLGHQSHLLGVKTELFALVIDELNALE